MGYIEDQTFTKENFSQRRPPYAEFDKCTFIGCNFEGSNLSGITFTDCVFEECNLSLCILGNTGFKSVSFKDCKMLGLRFDECNTFGLFLKFVGCTLNHSSFFQLKLTKTLFRSCQLQEVDFSSCDLMESTFDDCQLQGAIFDRTKLVKTDFRTSIGYSLDPEKNNIKKARFSIEGLPGLLRKYDVLID